MRTNLAWQLRGVCKSVFQPAASFFKFPFLTCTREHHANDTRDHTPKAQQRLVLLHKLPMDLSPFRFWGFGPPHMFGTNLSLILINHDDCNDQQKLGARTWSLCKSLSPDVSFPASVTTVYFPDCILKFKLFGPFCQGPSCDLLAAQRFA